MGFFRYPGGKLKIKNEIISKINEYLFNTRDTIQYREPFFGGGSIGLEVMENNANSFLKNINVWINDIDPALFSLWRAILEKPEELITHIKAFKPSVDSFFSFKEKLLNGCVNNESVYCGFMKLAIHQMSYSGLGTKSGGPIGGVSQKSDYDVACRWFPDTLCKNINKIYNLFSIYTPMLTCKDFSVLIEDESAPAVLYLDPPYFKKGESLYEYSFDLDDHERLSDLLFKTNHKWLLSYDDCDEIRKLYSWANIDRVNINYSITNARNAFELLIHKGGF